MAGFDSLYTGITGLNSYQSWIDMISNNIANVDTTGFKGQRMTFADLFYQNQSFPSGPTDSSGGVDGQQLGFGVKVNTVDTEFAQGGFQTTGINTDLAINGDGFFILNNLQGNGTPTYTRDGAFSLNQNGVLYDPASGLAVQGWEANAAGDVTASGTTGAITIPIGLQEQATATGAGAKTGPNNSDKVFDVSMGGNLDQTQWQNSFLSAVGVSGASAAAPYTVTTTMYDSLGNAHEATITYVPVAANTVAATSGGTLANQATAGGFVMAPGTLQVVGSTATTNNITVTVEGNGTACVTDGNGDIQSGLASGAKVTIDGSSFNIGTIAAGDKNKQATYTISAAFNGLPSDVENAAGVSVKPATRWAVDVSFTDGTTFDAINQSGQINAAGVVTTATTFNKGATSGTIGYAYFDQNGQFINTSTIEGDTADPAGTAYSITGANLGNFVHATGTNPNVNAGNELNVESWGTGAGNNAQAPTGPDAIGLDFSNNASLAGSYGANVISQNGYAAGTLDNITIGDDGTVTGAFTNGQTKTLAQLALARFQNEGGLSRIGSNQFEASDNSGLAQIGTAAGGSNGNSVYGSIQSGALEQSNVNLADEFTNLIVAQRAFEANTRGITTADQNLETIINLRASEN
jgi:flagellar hook protein FlgE